LEASRHVGGDRSLRPLGELGELIEIAWQGAVADAELPGEVGGGAGAGGKERGEA